MIRGFRELLCGVMMATCLLCMNPAPLYAEEAAKPAGEEEADTAKESADEADIPMLEEITVVEDKPCKKDAAADTTELDGEDLVESPDSSTLEAVASEVPSMYVSSRGAGFHGVASGASGAIHMRGLGGSPNSQVLVLEDGAPDYQGIFGHPIPDAYLPYLLDSIEVIKGGDSVLYGTNAMGGVINMRTRWADDDEIHLFFDTSYGSFNSYRLAGAALESFKHVDGQAFVSFRGSDGHRDEAGGRNLIAHAGIRFRITPSARLILRDKLANLKGFDPGPANNPNTNHWYDVWRNSTSLSFSWLSPKVKINATTFFNYGNHRLYDGFKSHDFLFGGNTEVRWNIVKQLELLVGIAGDGAYGMVENRIDRTSEDISLEGSGAFYNQLSWEPLKGLIFVAGTRELYDTATGFLFLYKGGVSYEIIKGLKVRGRYVTNYRRPTLRELYLPFPVANPNLKAEKSASADGGISVDYHYVAAEATAYYTRVDNMIKYFGSWPTAEVVNIDHMNFWGVEGRVRLRNLWGFSLMAGVDWKDVGRYTKQNPDLKVNGSLGWEYKGFSVSLQGQWVSGLYQNNYSRDAMDDAWHMDLSLQYHMEKVIKKLPPMDYYLHVRNLTNNQYEFIIDYPMPGINVTGGIRMYI